LSHKNEVVKEVKELISSLKIHMDSSFCFSLNNFSVLFLLFAHQLSSKGVTSYIGLQVTSSTQEIRGSKKGLWAEVFQSRSYKDVKFSLFLSRLSRDTFPLSYENSIFLWIEYLSRSLGSLPCSFCESQNSQVL
jgi:hypothetical protein